ncbi:MAG TPA: metallophosphoesterase [Thiohalobacter sp.]|nr:metallophosphoesterase [Thiohalobacter sp.]
MRGSPFRVDPTLTGQLIQRLGRAHARQRLGLEQDYEARVFGQGRNFFHLENWYSLHGLIRLLLRASLLHGRGRRNARRIRLRHNPVSIAGLPPACAGLRLLHISDLHLDMAEDMPAVLIETVRELDYDLCVLTGDFRARTHGPCESALHGLGRLRTHLASPVYAVLGNHDSIRMVPGIEALDIQLLLNESVRYARGDDGIYLVGVDDPHYYRADNLEKAVGGVPDEAVSILLAHSPELYRQASCLGFDLMLCGHTHGGQICLPGGQPILCNARAPRALCRGAWRYNGMQGYTSAGSGACIVDVRLNCPPEVTLHTLMPAQAGSSAHEG